MPITVDSSQWTGEQDASPAASPVVWGEFAEHAAVDRAAEHLQSQDWFRRSIAPLQAGGADNEQVGAPDEHPKETGQRGLRQSVVGIGSYATATLAAGVVVATGGAALPAVAAAAAAGGATFAAGEAVGAAADPVGGKETEGRKEPVKTAGPALGISVATPELRQQAEHFLQQEGAHRIWVEENPGA